MLNVFTDAAMVNSTKFAIAVYSNRHRESMVVEETDSNMAEYRAALFAIGLFGETNVRIHTDSRYTVDKVKALAPAGINVSITWIPREDNPAHTLASAKKEDYRRRQIRKSKKRR